MTKQKSTKRALLMSALALLMCVSMLVGSTFAWFVDSVSSTGNKIISGNLDIKLYTLANDRWDEITDSSTPLFDDDILWEPGFTYAKVLKVKNAGSLALKWQAQFVSNVSNFELSILADVIDVYVCPGATELAADRTLAGYTKVGTIREFVNTISSTTVGTLAPNAEATLGLVLKMREEAGNEYQGKTLEAFDIRIVATQLSVENESDSFGPDYDVNAPLADTASATMQADKSTVLNFSASPSTTYPQTNIEIPAGAYTNKLVEMTVTAENSLFNVSANGSVVGSIDVTMTVNGEEVSEELANGVYTVTTYISKGLENVSISYTGNDGKDQPMFVSYDAATGKLVFTTNHFSEYAVSGSALAYDKAKDTAINDVKAVIDNTAAIIPPVNSEVFAEKVEEAIKGGQLDSETIDKDDIYPAKIGNDYYTSLADALANANGKTVTILKDITVDADNTITIAAGKNITIDLNGKTIAGVSNKTDSNRNIFDVRGTLTVKNGTMTILHTGTNMGWGSSTNVFNVTAGGVLNITNATIENLGGSDMAFCVHLNNWGEVTLNAQNSTFKSNYVGVRAFNSGYDMNNITLNGCTFLTGNSCFWVHNYTAADFGGSADKAAAADALLNLNFTNTTFTRTNGSNSVVRFGFTNSIYYSSAEMNEVVASS